MHFKSLLIISNNTCNSSISTLETMWDPTYMLQIILVYQSPTQLTCHRHNQRSRPTDTKMKVMGKGNLVAALVVVLSHQHCYTAGGAAGTVPAAGIKSMPREWRTRIRPPLTTNPPPKSTNPQPSQPSPEPPCLPVPRTRLDQASPMRRSARRRCAPRLRVGGPW
jgi:hypothetical protein